MDVNINQLMEMTGKSFRTIKKKLDTAKVDVVRSDGRSDFYPCQVALEALYEQTEKARENLLMAKANREMAEIELARLRGELVEATEVDTEWARIGTLVKNKVLGIASKMKQRYSNVTIEQYEYLDQLLREALEEIADNKG